MRLFSSLSLPILFSTLLLAACGGGSDDDDIFTPNPDPGPGPGPSGNSIYLNVVPPGANGNSAGGIGSPVPGTPVLQYPVNFRDQLDLYGNLAYAQQGLTATPCTPPTSITAHLLSSNLACNYFKDHGLEPDTVVSTRELTAPNGKTVTIRRNGWGVPYITGQDRGAAQYGMGFAAAQDRLWLFDVLRQVGRGRVSEYLGPSATTYDLDNQFGGGGGYSEQELTDIVDAAIAKIGNTGLGALFLNDVEMFVAGMNAYIDFLQTPGGAALIPPEYFSLALSLPPKFPPRDFTINDIVANAVLIQAQFGRGGGGEASNVRLLQSQDANFDFDTPMSAAACNLWRDLRHALDPDAAYTTNATFLTQSPASVSETCPQALPAGAAIWDPGSLQGRPLLVTSSGGPLPAPGGGGGLCAPGQIPVIGGQCLPLFATAGSSLPMLAKADEEETVIPFRPDIRRQLGLLAAADTAAGLRKAFVDEGGSATISLSNWIGVNSDQTEAGHPIIVAGPQTSYFVPQLLWEAAVVSNGGTAFELAAHGISTVNLPYIVIGRGKNFAWSATSAGSDLIDTRVSTLCNTNGSPASLDDGDADTFPNADGYRYDLDRDGQVEAGECARFYRRVDQWTAFPTPASIALGGPTQADTVTRYILRTHYGPVIATATLNGAPVAISEQRSTFFGDVDTTAPFALLTSTGTPMTHTRFKQLFNSTTSTFNWIYTDNKDLAFIQSGLYPQRHPQQHPELPVWGDGRFEWVADQNLAASFFATYGGDGNSGAKSFPSRAQPQAVGDPMSGYFEWPGYLPLQAHIQDTNPGTGYLANWNNAGARGWWAADSNGTFGPTHRMELLQQRLLAFKASGKKHTVASMIEIMGDAAYTDLRGQALLPLLLQIMQSGPLSADQQSVVTLMQAWIDAGSHVWIGATAPGGQKLGSLRRDRDHDGIYDMRAAVVLMDAWYQRLIPALLPQMVAVEQAGGPLLTGRYDAPRQQGSAYQEGWYQHMRRVLQMAMSVPGHTDYRVLRCANSSSPTVCRDAVLTALTQSLADLGGLGNQANWDGTQLANHSGEPGVEVEEYDNVHHTSFSFLPVPTIHWTNRPTWQQVVQVNE
jgi:acyl-homoserine lactone acylase PvdQ